MRKKEQTEERWLLSLRKALVAAGAPVGKVAKRIAEALDAEYVEVVKHQGTITDEKAYVDHPTRLRAASIATEIYAPRRTGQLDAARPILNVQAGAKVQLIFFGEARDALPEAGTVVPSVPTPMSDPLMAQLIRQGKLNPDGTIPKPAEAKTEASKVLPAEGKAQARGEGWLK